MKPKSKLELYSHAEMKLKEIFCGLKNNKSSVWPTLQLILDSSTLFLSTFTGPLESKVHLSTNDWKPPDCSSDTSLLQSKLQVESVFKQRDENVTRWAAGFVWSAAGISAKGFLRLERGPASVTSCWSFAPASTATCRRCLKRRGQH